MSVSEAVAMAIGLHQKGEIGQAADVYRQILTAVPDQADALHFLGVAEHQQGRSLAALDLIDRAVLLVPDQPDMHNNRGNVLRLLSRLDEAEASYRRALELRPDDPAALNNLGTVLRERGLMSDAVATFRRVVAVCPDHYEAHQNLGNALGALNGFDEALEAHKQALRLRPASADSYRQLGAMLHALGRFDQAAEIYGRWLAIEPGNPVARHMMAACTGAEVPPRATDDYVREAFDQFAPHFENTLARLEYRAPLLVAEEVARALGAPGARLDVLDAGCGTGLCAPHLRPYARHLCGVDLSERMIERARERKTYDDLVVAELTAWLGQSEGAYDLVVSADTLVYFGDLAPVFAAASKALRPGGHLVFTVEHATPEQAPSGYRMLPHGRYCHTEAYLAKVVEDAGLAIDSTRAVELRKELGRWVEGTLARARRPGKSA